MMKLPWNHNGKLQGVLPITERFEKRQMRNEIVGVHNKHQAWLKLVFSSTRRKVVLNVLAAQRVLHLSIRTTGFATESFCR